MTQNRKNLTEGLPSLKEQSNISFLEAMNWIRKGANPNVLNSQGEALLHQLIKLHNPDNGLDFGAIIKELVHEHHANVDIENKNGQTPLQFLLEGEFLPVQAELLVDLGANFYRVNSYGDLLLKILLKKNHPESKDNCNEFISKLYARGKLTQQLKSLLDSEFNFENLQKAMELIKNGAYSGTFNSQGQTLLHLLAKHNKRTRRDNDYSLFIKELVTQHGVYVDLLNQEGLTPLQYVMDHGCNQFQVRTLLDLDANSNVLNSKGESLLNLFTKFKSYNSQLNSFIDDLVKKYGMNVDIRNKDKITPLESSLIPYSRVLNSSTDERMRSRLKDYSSCVKKLLMLGAKVDHLTPEMLACCKQTLINIFSEDEMRKQYPRGAQNVRELFVVKCNGGKIPKEYYLPRSYYLDLNFLAKRRRELKEEFWKEVNEPSLSNLSL